MNRILRAVAPQLNFFSLRIVSIRHRVIEAILGNNTRQDGRFVMRTSLLRQLLQAHADGDNEAFRKATLQLAAIESKAGHTKIAEEIKAFAARLGPAQQRSQTLIDMAQPRAELAGLLDGGYCRERLRDIVLSEGMRNRFDRIIQENRSRAQLESWGVRPARKLLFFGPPGCGKTLAARVLGGELGMPVMTVRFDGLFSRFLGSTANHLKVIFEEMAKRPAVYLFDEFDAIGKFRGDAQDVGEARRVVTSFLQLVDVDQSHSLIIAATNYDEILDRAVFRRFDARLEFSLPDERQVDKLLRLRFSAFEVPATVFEKSASLCKGASFADVARGCDNAIKSMALEGRQKLIDSDIVDAFLDIQRKQT
jgi:AAA+ superfamily predicted ATPase